MVLQWIKEHKRLLILGYLLKVALFFPLLASADIGSISYNATSSYDTSGTVNAATSGVSSFIGITGDGFGQTLGTGISMTMRSYVIWLQQAGADNRSSIILFECDDSAYTVNCAAAYREYHIASTTAFTYYNMNEGTFHECYGVPCSDTSFTFNPTKYYAVLFIDNTSTASTRIIKSSTSNIYSNGSCYRNCGSASDISFLISSATSTPNYCIENTETRIVNFTPLDGATTTNPVNFTLDACINPDDLGIVQGVNITLHNIDQNVILLSDFSPSDIYLISERNIETPGLFQFATTTTIGEGNYRLEACILRSYLFGYFINPLSSISECESHQFIVGTSTFIGNISQSIFGQTQDFFEGLTATSSEALANTCNPLSSKFGIRECTAFLFIPDGNSLRQTMQNARSGILSRVPWGYFTRFVTILTDSATSSIPSFTASIQMGPGQDLTPEITTITIDPGDMLAGASNLLETTYDPITNKNARDVFYPMVQLTVAISVLMTIVSDVVRSHRNSNEQESRKGKLS